MANFTNKVKNSRKEGINMKRLTVLLTLGAWLLGAALASASGSIVGNVYSPGTERSMQVTGRGVMWDLSAPQRSKSSAKATIWLINRNLDFAAIPYPALKKWYQEGVIPENTPIYRAEADEKGRFAFQDVPAAAYYVLILDPHSQNSLSLAAKNDRDELLERLPHVDEFELFMVGTRSCLVEKVNLQDGQTVKIRPTLF